MGTLERLSNLERKSQKKWIHTDMNEYDQLIFDGQFCFLDSKCENPRDKLSGHDDSDRLNEVQ